MAKTKLKTKQQVYWKKYYEKNKDRLLEGKRKWWKEWYSKNKDELLPVLNRKKWAIKREVLTHYGNGKLACVKCGFEDLRALTIDHINGGGRKERMEAGNGLDRGGVSFYRWLRKKHYPPEYQTLCMNCQLIKQVKTPSELL